MRIIYLFILLLASQAGQAQACPPPGKDTTAVPVRLRCKVDARDTVLQPLFVVDGAIVPGDQIKQIDPGNIESVSILKPDTLQFGCRRSHSGVVIITLKKLTNPVTIVDAGTGEVVPGATVGILSETDSLWQAADSRGQVKKKHLFKDISYRMRVSAIGYKQADLSLAGRKLPDTVRLVPEAFINDGVVVTCTPSRVIICYSSCGLRCYKITSGHEQCENNQQKGQIALSAFPNPLARGQQHTIEWTSATVTAYNLQVFDQGGRLVFNTPLKAKEGLNRYTWQPEQQWAAGTYIVRLTGADGKNAGTTKLVRL